MEAFVQVVLVTGAAGALFYVLKWVVDGKLHSHSEVAGLQADKKELFEANKLKDEAIAEATATLKSILEILENEESDVVRLLLEVLARLPEHPEAPS